MGDFMGYIFNIRTSISRLYAFSDGPVPFAYSHYFTFMSLLFMPLFAYGVANINRPQERYTAHELVRLIVKEREIDCLSDSHSIYR